MPVDTKGLSVAEMLERARAQHLEYRRLSPRMASKAGKAVPQAGDPVGATAALDAAASYRKAAEDADPHFDDPAWEADEAANGVPHHAVLTFYGEQFARPDHAERLQKIKARDAKDAAKGHGHV